MADLSIPEAAAQLGVSADTIRRRIKQGKLQAALHGGRYRVTILDIPELHTHAYAPPMQELKPAYEMHTQELAALNALLSEIIGERDHLRTVVDAQNRQLADAATERGEMRRLLAGSLQQRLPEHSPTEAVVTPAPALQMTEERVQTKETRPWWKRLLKVMLDSEVATSTRWR